MATKTAKKPKAAASKTALSPIGTDPKTGLEWSPELPGVKNWKAALKAAEPYNDGGPDDWRVPSINELITLIDFSKSGPAADTKLIPDMKPRFYWSSTPLASSPGAFAWGVLFFSGGVDYLRQDYQAFVRLVRGPRAGQ